MDIDEILLYIRKRWGVDQRRHYGTQLKQAMRLLLNHSDLGQLRDGLYPGCRSLLVERHAVFYRIADDEVIVGRILHTSPDPTGKVTP